MLEASTLDFLKELKENNNRDWFTAHKKEYQKAKSNMDEFVAELLKGIATFDPAIAELEPKHCVFRIYRDVRFSKDKSPYKTNMGGYMCKGGKKSPYGGYYLHIEPGGCFLAGGMYMPPNDILAKVRQEVDYNTDEFKSILNNKSFAKTFGELQGEKLKTAPKNYDKDHPEIELLKHKSFIVMHAVADKKVTGKDFLEYCVETFKELKPFLDFLNRSLD